MGDAADRARAARTETPPLTAGHTLHWDGTGAVSQSGELPQDAAPAGGSRLAGPRTSGDWTFPPRPQPLRWSGRWRPPSPCIWMPACSWPPATRCSPGATGHLRWVPAPPQSARPAVVHPVLVVHTRDEALPVPYAALVLHLPRHDPLHRHIALVLEAERDATDAAVQLYAQALTDALVVHFLRRYAASQGLAG